MLVRIVNYIRINGPWQFFLRSVELIFERSATFFWTVFFQIKCRLLGVKAGHQLEVFGNCIIRKHPLSQIWIGNGVQFISSSWRSSTANCFNCKLSTINRTARIIIGDHSGTTGGVIVARSKTIAIGARCLLSPGVVIMDSDFHVVWPPERRHNALESDIDMDRSVTIEENVWIGMGCIILKGVTIGKNSVISAGSVVKQDIPPNSIAGGNPAKVLRHLSEFDT